jgi:CubicO group peptidase (beta-lactamase class C family)
MKDSFSPHAALRRFGRVTTGLFLLIAGCSLDPNEEDMEPEVELDFGPFDEALAAFLTTHGLEGATAVVVHLDHGMVHLSGYGAFESDRISLVASSSKVLSAGVLMWLADEGLLDLDVPVSNYLAAWGEHKTDVTAAQLLSNSSGLPGLIENPTYVPYLCQFVENGTLSACAETIYTANDEADRVAPDTAFRYGGGQWQLAGGLAEVVSGMSWDELVENVYGRPCGLKATGYANHFMRASTGADLESLDYPTFFEGDPANLDPTENPNVEGGAYTTAEDYGRVLLMHLRGGECEGTGALSTQSIERMRADRIGEVYGGVTIDPTMPGYGFGWWVSRDEPGVVADAGAYGSMPWLDLGRGYGTMIILEAEATLGVLARLETKPILDSIFDASLLQK